MNPNHIGQSLQPVAVPGHFAFVLRIDPFEIPETLREVFHPVVDLLFGEDPDTVRSGLFVESLAVGVVVRISEERPIESEVVIGFWIEILADEKQDAVSSETGASFLEIVFQAVHGMCNTVEQGCLRNELLHCFQYGRCASNSPLYVILGIGEQQLVEGRLIDPLSHRRATCLRQDSVSRRSSFNVGIRIVHSASGRPRKHFTFTDASTPSRA